jgi:hypothetical protein
LAVSEQHQKPKRPLQSELQKRKTQEIQRRIEAKQVTRTQGSTPLNPPEIHSNSRSTGNAPVTQSPSADVRRVTQSVSRVFNAPPNPPRRITRFLMRVLAGVLVASLIIIVLVGVLLRASNPTTIPTPTFAPLPNVKANAVVDHLKTAGLTIANLREFPVPNETWHAEQELQFEISQGNDKGLVLLLSYASAEQKVPDLALNTTTGKFKQWRVMTLSNVIMLVSPETSQTLQSQLSVQLTKLVAAPYRPFLSSPSETITVTP